MKGRDYMNAKKIMIILSVLCVVGIIVTSTLYYPRSMDVEKNVFEQDVIDQKIKETIIEEGNSEKSIKKSIVKEDNLEGNTVSMDSPFYGRWRLVDDSTYIMEITSKSISVGIDQSEIIESYLYQIKQNIEDENTLIININTVDKTSPSEAVDGISDVKEECYYDKLILSNDSNKLTYVHRFDEQQKVLSEWIRDEIKLDYGAVYISKFDIVINIPDSVKAKIIIEEDENYLYVKQKCSPDCCNNAQKICVITATERKKINDLNKAKKSFAYIGENSTHLFFLSASLDMEHNLDKYVKEYDDMREEFDYIRNSVTIIDDLNKTKLDKP